VTVGPLGGGGQDPLEPGQLSIPGKFMAALIAIGVFIIAIFVLNTLEFGRPD
jgi:hypothetical protein